MKAVHVLRMHMHVCTCVSVWRVQLRCATQKKTQVAQVGCFGLLLGEERQNDNNS